MLKKGKFIKEPPPRISAFYLPYRNDRQFTPEERLAQDILLGWTNPKTSFFSKVFSLMLRA
jgi:hypothetical protein